MTTGRVTPVPPPHPSPELGDCRVTPPEGKRGCPEGVEGLGYLGRGGGAEPPHRRGPRTQPGPPQPVEEGGQSLRHGQESAPPPAGARASARPGRGGVAAGPSTIPRRRDRPNPAPRPARCPPPAVALRPTRDTGPAVGRPAARSEARAGVERAVCRALTIVSAAAASPPLHSASLRTPSPDSLRPSARHVTSSRWPHVTPPFLSSPPSAPVPSRPLAPPHWPAWPSKRGSLEAGPRAPPWGWVAGPPRCRKVGGACVDAGSSGLPRPIFGHVGGGSLTGFFATPNSPLGSLSN